MKAYNNLDHDSATYQIYSNFDMCIFCSFRTTSILGKMFSGILSSYNAKFELNQVTDTF